MYIWFYIWYVVVHAKVRTHLHQYFPELWPLPQFATKTLLLRYRASKAWREWRTAGTSKDASSCRPCDGADCKKPSWMGCLCSWALVRHTWIRDSVVLIQATHAFSAWRELPASLPIVHASRKQTHGGSPKIPLHAVTKTPRSASLTENPMISWRSNNPIISWQSNNPIARRRLYESMVPHEGRETP